MAAVTFSLDMNLHRTTIKIQNSVSMWLAAVGGFAVSVYLVFYILEYFCTFKRFENYMASELYTVLEQDSEGPAKVDRTNGEGDLAG